MIYIGVDHGTTAMRFSALSKGPCEPVNLEILRTDAASMSEEQVISTLEKRFGTGREDIGLIAVTYSMGDAITAIEDIRTVQHRGVQSIEGAGQRTGGGSKVFDAILNSGIPAVVIPGIHEDSNTDPRMNIFSHSTSPEKIGIAYHAFCKGPQDFVLSDISSNTVTLGVAKGRIIGAIDACIFAPGLHHGPLDVKAIREVDLGKMSANEAFTNTGVLKRAGYSNINELTDAANKKDPKALLALDTLALFAAMEIASIQVLLQDYGVHGEIFIEGSVAEVPYIVEKIEQHLGVQVHVLDRWSAAIGCAEMARDIDMGAREILGLEVKYGP
ncbi:MAG: methanogenesis marker 12 protein [Methanomethylovorans sp.]|uniref:methanogenesis marker 12 protein n=1 Tax=Methanomethylovorans sp. TaxID=2758717 RepID=UPI000AA3AD57|nr:methanogenesis marker 12 protein [Methanomethylovorans sp.]